MVAAVDNQKITGRATLCSIRFAPCRNLPYGPMVRNVITTIKNRFSFMEKTYIFPSEGAGYGRDGFDPNLFAALNNNGGGFGGNNGFWWIILFALFWGRNGFGNYGGGYDQSMNSTVLSAVQGNRTAISELASSLNCSVGQINTVLSNIQSTIQSVGAQNNLSFAQTVNAIQSGNAAITSALQSCCCEIKQAISGVNIGVERGFANLAYENATQACAIKQNATDNASRILAKLDSIEDSRKDREIASLTAALTAANSRAERQAELAPIYKSLADIECKQPNTVTVPYQPFVTVPNCVAFQAGLYGNGFPFGFNNGNGIFG